VDVKGMDWDKAWQEKRAQRTSPSRGPSFWDGRAVSFDRAASESGYVHQFLSIMKPERPWHVLDMGCGSGLLTFALAPHVKAITAVDYSPKMLSILKDRCRVYGIGTITAIEGSWEDDWDARGIGEYDVAIASRSLVADDLRSSIMKLVTRARRRVYISTIVGDGPFDRRLFDAVGRPLDLGPDYIYNYNMLYQMGILANVAFITERRSRTHEGLDAAVAGMAWMFDNMSPEEEGRLRAYLKAHLVAAPDGQWTLSYENTVRCAIIWWDTTQGAPAGRERVHADGAQGPRKPRKRL
jgi:SAM-dependent methyltransferase